MAELRRCLECGYMKADATERTDPESGEMVVLCKNCHDELVAEFADDDDDGDRSLANAELCKLLGHSTVNTFDPRYKRCTRCGSGVPMPA